MIGVDSNVLLRYLTQDDPVQSTVATHFVERELSAAKPGFVSLLTLAEILWVLKRRRAATRAELAEVLQHLLSDSRFVVQHAHAAWLAVSAARSLGVDLPDALVAFVNEVEGCTHTMTFDRRATRLRGMRLMPSPT